MHAILVAHWNLILRFFFQIKSEKEKERERGGGEGRISGFNYR